MVKRSDSLCHCGKAPAKANGYCSDCAAERARDYRKRNPGRPAKRTYSRCYRCGVAEPPEGFYSNGYCRPCGRAYHKARHHHPDKHEQIKAQHRAHYQRHRRKIIDRELAKNRRQREAVLAHYGGSCACCGEHRYEFLALDHIGGGGNKHRKAIGVIGSKIYRWILTNDFPTGFRVLCHNCNVALGIYKRCPHTMQQ